MSDKLFEQDWFINAIKPTDDEKVYLASKVEDFIRRTNEYQSKGLSGQEASIRVAKEMLGR